MKKKSDYVMSHSELASVKDERRSAESALKEMEREDYGKGGKGEEIDRGRLRKEAKRYANLEEQHNASAPTGAAKDRLAKKAEELRDKIRDGMPSKAEMNNLRRHPEAPTKNLAWEKRNAGSLQEYKQVMRRLERDNPYAASVERFRRK